MKAFKGIIICTVIAILFQNLIFLYVEKVYLSDSSKYNIEKVDNDSASEKMEVNIDEKAEDIRTSYDGKYISYMKNNKLIICDTKDEKEKNYKEEKGELVYYKWLNDCEKIVAIEKTVNKGETFFIPMSYDVKTGQSSEITDFNMNEIKIQGSSSESKVDLISFSTASSSLYIKIKNEDGNSDLYYANQMNELKKVKSHCNIGKVVVPITSTDAVMEIENKISVLNGADNIKIPNGDSVKILGTDKNNKVYFCSDKGERTDTIYYADITKKNYKWSKITLKSSEPVENIHVEYSGKIYVDHPSEKKVMELTDKKEIKYKGEFLQTYSKGIITKNDNTIIKKELSK